MGVVGAGFLDIIGDLGNSGNDVIGRKEVMGWTFNPFCIGVVIGGKEVLEGDIRGKDRAGGREVDTSGATETPFMGEPSELVVTAEVSIFIPNLDSVSFTDSIKSGKFHSIHLDQNPAVSVPDLVQSSLGSWRDR